MTRYSNGAARERRIKKSLESEGYTVLRTAGSHGFCDLIAIKNGVIFFLQVKPKGYSKKKVKELLNEYIKYNQLYNGQFRVVSLAKEVR